MKIETRSDVKSDKEKEIKDMTKEKEIKDMIKEKEIKDIVRGFVGKNIIVSLRNKKILKGRLESVSQYELLLTVLHEPVLIMKHAIDYIELTDTT